MNKSFHVPHPPSQEKSHPSNFSPSKKCRASFICYQKPKIWKEFDKLQTHECIKGWCWIPISCLRYLAIKWAYLFIDEQRNNFALPRILKKLNKKNQIGICHAKRCSLPQFCIRVTPVWVWSSDKNNNFVPAHHSKVSLCSSWETFYGFPSSRYEHKSRTL